MVQFIYSFELARCSFLLHWICHVHIYNYSRIYLVIESTTECYNGYLLARNIYNVYFCTGNWLVHSSTFLFFFGCYYSSSTFHCMTDDFSLTGISRVMTWAYDLEKNSWWWGWKIRSKLMAHIYSCKLSSDRLKFSVITSQPTSRASSYSLSSCGLLVHIITLYFFT